VKTRNSSVAAIKTVVATLFFMPKTVKIHSTFRRWSYQKKFKNGEVILNTGLMLGYTKVGKDDEGRAVYEINEAEAEIVRRIYREYLAGTTVARICGELEADGILTKFGKTDVLLMEVAGYTPWKLSERMEIRNKVKEQNPDCKIVLVVDENTEEEIAEQVKQESRTIKTIFSYTNLSAQVTLICC